MKLSKKIKARADIQIRLKMNKKVFAEGVISGATVKYGLSIPASISVVV